MPEPTVPPTPAVPLAALLARDDLGLRQIAGPSDPAIVIHWAHTSEMADPYPYLLGGELLLTAGVHIPEAAGSGTYFDDYVSRIVAAGGAALGFGLAPVHDTVPRALVAACDTYELPLLEVPPRTTFSGVARAVWQLMAQARLAELRRVTEAQQSLAAAASRPDPVRAVLRQLGQRVGGWAVLYGPDGMVVAEAGRTPGGDARGVLREPTEVVRPADAVPPAEAVRPTGQGQGAGSGPGSGPGAPAAKPEAGRAPAGATPDALHNPPQAAQPTGTPPPASAPAPQTEARQAPADTTPDALHNPPEAAQPTSTPPPASAPAPQTEARQAPADTTPDALHNPPEAAQPTGTPPRTSGPAAKSQAASAVSGGSSGAGQPRSVTGHTPGPGVREALGGPGAREALAGPGIREALAGPGVREALAGLAEVVRPSGPGTPASATDSVAGTHLAAYALGAGRGFVLGVAAPHREPGDHTIASVAAVLLSLLTGEQQSGSGAARMSALVRVLLGAEPESVAPLLGGERWLVVHARPDTAAAPDPVAASALGAALGSPLVDLARDGVRVLVPADREPAPQPGWTLGVSAPATARDWPAADAQAARALSRARATRTPLHRHGTHRPALTDLLSPDEAQAHARTLLAPLTAPLTETLRTWLSLHGSWDRTAVALSVHRNTVRQRIARCAALLDTDLDDPDVRMELWFALRHDEG